MALTAQQIVSLATQMAKAPGMVVQAGQLLNSVLQELCQTYDFQLARKTFYFVFQPGLTAIVGNSIYGSGPYPLPADFLRCQDEKAVFWTLLGVPYPMVPIDLSEFDMAVQQAGQNSYPYWFCTDMSLGDEAQQGNATPVAYVYPPPSGAYPVTVRYFAQMPDIAAPETSAQAPWFPNSNYLITRLAGELMKLTDDSRWQAFLGEGPEGAQGILREYLKLKDDKSNRTATVKMDARRFGPTFSRLPNTKRVGW